jgi:hypothetical protein
MPRTHDHHTRSCFLHSALGCLLWVIALLACGAPALAHHGGLGIEGDLVQWALKVDQWQDENIAQGHRIKFLSYPRQPIVGNSTRLVFEIQSTATGQYVSGLTAQLEVQAPDGSQYLLPLPETTGVTAYYETAVVFEQAGDHTITFRSLGATVPFSTTFRKAVSRSTLHGDWPTLLGYGTVLAAFLVTWLGFVVSVQGRFTTLRAGAPSGSTEAC